MTSTFWCPYFILQQHFLHRCADLLSGVTKVLQSVGVNCCTIQPEFAACSGAPSCQPSAAADTGDLNPPCLLACGKACVGFMCCSSLQEETQTLSPPPAQEGMEEPQTLVMANNFTEGNWINIDSFWLNIWCHCGGREQILHVVCSFKMPPQRLCTIQMSIDWNITTRQETLNVALVALSIPAGMPNGSI